MLNGDASDLTPEEGDEQNSNLPAGIFHDSERSPQADRAELVSLVIAAVGEIQREINAAEARRAKLIEKARLLAEAASHEIVLDSHTLKPQRVDELTTRSFVAELAATLRLPESTVRTLVHEAQTLERELPATRESLENGDISYRHAKAVIDESWSLPDASLSEFEEAVLPASKSQTPNRFRATARSLRERMHPESIQKRRVRAAEGRRVEFEALNDGMAYVGVLHTAEVAKAIYNATLDTARSLRSQQGEARTFAQIAADAFADAAIAGFVQGGDDTSVVSAEAISVVTAAARDAQLRDIPQSWVAMRHEMITAGALVADSVKRRMVSANVTALSRPPAGPQGSRLPGRDLGRSLPEPPSGRTRPPGSPPEGLRQDHASLRRGLGIGARRAAIRPTVHVTVPVLNLLGRSDEPATLEGYGPIDDELARELAANAPSFTRILTHPETGAVLSVGRDNYRVPADLKKALVVRDETCRFPGCNRKAVHCDLDHTVDWQLGGETDIENLAHLCREHHVLKHETAWTVTQSEGGDLTWTSPGGASFTTQPETTIRASYDDKPPF